MTRLPFITNDDLSSDQQAVWDSVTNGKRGPAARFTYDEGGLVGPFNAAMHAPATGRKIAQLGEALRFETSLDVRLLELAISWHTSHPLVASVIAGATKPAQIEANVAAAGWDLTEDERAQVDAVILGG